MRASIVIAVSCLCSALLAQQQFWMQVNPAQSPGPRSNHVMAFDSNRGVIVLFGGGGSGGTWEYDGKSWSRIATSSEPPLQSLAMAYDAARKRTVLAVSQQGSPVQTWEWDGLAWTRNTTQRAPSGRYGHAIAYDAVRQRTVLFGGGTGGGQFSDTWEYDGIDWAQRGSGGPLPRLNHAMTYDSRRSRIVLFGGWQENNTMFADTWEWDGVAWREYFGVPGPAARISFALAEDAARGVVVLHGGRDTRAPGAWYGDTWEWDGIAWTKRSLFTNPGAIWRSAMAWDARRSRAVFYGGDPMVGGDTDRMWEYRTIAAQPPTYSPFGTGCMGTSGIPSLAADASTPLPYLGETFQARLANLPVGLGRLPFGLLGASKTQWGPVPLPLDLTGAGMPGCKLFVSGDLLFPLQNSNGSALWPLEIPRDLGFLGVPFYQQGLVLDPGANQASMILTNAGEGKVGIR